MPKENDNPENHQGTNRDQVDPCKTADPSERYAKSATTGPMGNLMNLLNVLLVSRAISFVQGVLKKRMPSRLQPHHILTISAIVLMLVAPTFDRHYEHDDEILVQSSYLPVVAHVSSADGEGTWNLGSFASQETNLTGPADVTIAPAIPGMHLLVPWGATIAFFPLSMALAAGAWAFRRMGGR